MTDRDSPQEKAPEQATNQTEDHDIHKALSHPTRIEILHLIGESFDGTTYSDLSQTLDLETGTLYHHLKLLSQLVKQDDEKRYNLTRDGHRALRMLEGLDSDPEGFDLAESAYFLNPILRLITFQPLIAGLSTYKSLAIIFGFGLVSFSSLIGFVIYAKTVGPFLLNSPPLSLPEVLFIGILSWIIAGGTAEFVSRGLGSTSNSMVYFFANSLIFLPSGIFGGLIFVVSRILEIMTPIIPEFFLLLLIISQVWGVGILLSSTLQLKGLSSEKALIVSLSANYVLLGFSWLL